MSDNPYTKPFTGRMCMNQSFDVYDVCNAYELDSMRSHAVKKLLVTGGRSGGKNELQDLKEARWTLDELIKEMENEDQFTDTVLKEASNAILNPSTRFAWKNKIKAQAIEEAVSECMLESDDAMVKAKAAQMMHYADKLRGQK